MPVEVDRDARHLAVVAAARRLIIEGGLSAVTFRNLARELDCSTMAISYYFPTMNDVLLATYRHVATISSERREALIARGVSDPVALFEEILPLGSDRFDDWKVWLCFWTSALFDPLLAREQKLRSQATSGQLARALVAAGWQPENARRRAQSVMTAIYGIAIHAIFDPGEWPPETQRQALRDALESLTAPGEKR